MFVPLLQPARMSLEDLSERPAARYLSLRPIAADAGAEADASFGTDRSEGLSELATTKDSRSEVAGKGYHGCVHHTGATRITVLSS